MSESSPKIAVTPPAFCKSKTLRTELTGVFPNSVFNDKDRYLTEAESVEFFKDADAVVVGRDLVNENVLSALPRLKIVSKYGIGVDNIDQDALERHGVVLGWTAGVNKRSVAEMTLCFMIGLCHNVFREGYKLKQNGWREDGGRQLTGKTVGIIGCGHIGKEVIHLMRPYHCRVLVRDILDMSEFCRTAEAVEAGLDELVRESDIISLHVPLTEQTRHMIDAPVLEAMKSTAFLINTSRGEVVDQQALKAALLGGTIAGAALDVFGKEPPDDPEFLACPNLMATPHIAGNTVEAVESMGRAAIDHIKFFFERGG